MRRTYIDWARGVAVLLMIEAHTIDAWTSFADKKSHAFGFGTVLGGFAAPMFLWLAGLGVVMSASRSAERTGSRTAALRGAIVRGLEIFALAFLFRLQAFVVSPGSHPVSLFRVDILNVMGPSMAVAGLLWVASRRTPATFAICAGAATIVALVTPIVRASPLVDQLPLWIGWYIRPAGEFTTFTFFPWAGFVFAGAAVGVAIAPIRDTTAERRRQLALGAAGVALGVACYLASYRPSLYTVPTNFWTSSPAWFGLRVGVLMAALALLAWVPPIRALEPLAVFGRASLFIYWIHVELVYGYASWLWRHRLPLWVWLLAYAAFTALMYRAIGWRDRFLENRRRRIPAPVTVQRA